MSDEAAVELTVRGAEKRDAGRGIARLPESARRRLGVLSGDTVLVEAERATVAKVWPGRGGLAPDSIQIDADTRANAGVKIGERVRVSAVDVDEADAITVVAPGRVTDEDALERHVKRGLRGRPVQEGDRVHLEHLSDAPFLVHATKPDGTVSVTDTTKVFVRMRGSATDARADDAAGESTADRSAGSRMGGESGPTDEARTTGETAVGSESSGGETGVTYEDIGGLDRELELVREMIELPLSEPEVFAHLGVDPPKGVLLHGPPGTGKTLIAKAVANEVDASFHTVSGPEIMSKYKGDSEENLRRVFQRAREESPAIVFFDEIDSIAAKRDDDSDVENRIVGQLLSLMDGLDARGEVVVIGATNRVDTLDPALRRGGRFDREIEIGVPNERGRREVLEVHTRRMPLADDVDLDRLSQRTHGFVGADLESLTTEAAMTALRRRDRGTALGDLRVTRADFETAMASVEPSAMREYVAEKPTEGFDAVGGLDDVKAALDRAVSWPLTYGPLFEAADAAPPSGVLLHGPPGTGKTLLARAVAGESGVNFINVAGPELLDRYVGESEKSVRELFERARQTAPAIVFFDEIDAIASRRGGGGGDTEVTERVVSQLLTELDRAAANPSLVVLAATNRREALDPALLRPGRFEQHIEVPLPDEAARRAILAVHTREKPLADDVDLDALAERTAGFSGADLEALCREAAVRAVTAVAERYDGAEANDHADELVVGHEAFEAAFATVSPATD
ncbi:AAA family ATPase [Salinigranum salinum]|uniref:AAA family ATPase n=1 Tax=Salinigranum salinum TaxID=1364937 RepID=UPI001260FA88|nr:AAA family ATPase [Salinigranum salinum]